MQALDQQTANHRSALETRSVWLKISTFLSNFGITDSMPNLEKIRTRIFNHATIIVFVGSSINSLESLIHQESGAVIIVIFALSPLIALYLSYKGQNIASRLYLTAFIPSFVFLFFPLFGGSLSLCFTYFAFMIAILIGYKDRRIIVINMLYVLGLFLISLTYTFTGDGIFRETTDHIDTIINVSVTMLIITWGIFNFLRGLIAQDKILNAQKEELELKNNELERIVRQNEIKTELLSMVARDIKSPIQSFKTSSKKMLELLESNNPFEVLAMANKLDQTGEKIFYHLDHLINWVLSQNDQLTVSRDLFDSERTILNIVNDFAFLIDEKQMHVRVAPFDDASVQTDESMFKIIMQDVIHNILKFSNEGSRLIMSQEIRDSQYLIRASSSGQHVSNQLINQIKRELSSDHQNARDHRSYGFQISLYLAQFLGGGLTVEGNEYDSMAIFLHLPVSVLEKKG